MKNMTDQVKKLKNYSWPKGFYGDGVHAGLRKVRQDMGWLYSEVPAVAAGVYTTNQFQAAPTTLTKGLIKSHHQLQAIIMNSANANSCTGVTGMKNAQAMQTWTAEKLKINPTLVGVASTGIIGLQLPMDKIKNGLEQLKLTKNAAITEAILTTDKHPKTITVEMDINGQLVTMSGFAKGSGMIHPNMATMLGFITTDAVISGSQLQEILSGLVDETFNQITVDGDTSTNDMVVAMANGLANNQSLDNDNEDFDVFIEGFHRVLTFLAQSIARDGEGATKLVEVNVQGAFNPLEAKQVAKAIVGSNLVKAAMFGEDPNWGRIMGAIGQTNAHLNVDKVAIWLNQIPIVQGSQEANFDEDEVKLSLKADQVVIDVDLNVGDAVGQAWGCDLTYNYVKINAAYRS